jgi:hypothetical protein
MKAAATTPLTITIDPSAAEFEGQESPVSAFVPPPPPLPPELCTSWDFFDPIDATGSASSNNEAGLTLNFSRLKGLREARIAEIMPLKGEEEEEAEATKSSRRHIEAPDDIAAIASSEKNSKPNKSVISEPDKPINLPMLQLKLLLLMPLLQRWRKVRWKRNVQRQRIPRNSSLTGQKILCQA